MKNLTLSILFLFAFSLISCQKSNEEKAKEAIRTYLNENLDDMSTYEPVKFGSLDTVMKRVDLSEFDKLPNPKAKRNDDSEKIKYIDLNFQMFHSYRLKDEKGAKYLVKKYFKLNNNFEVIDFKEYPFKYDPFASIAIPIESAAADTAAADTAAAIYEPYYPNPNKLPLMPQR